MMFGDIKVNKEGETCDVYGGGTGIEMEYSNFSLKKKITWELQAGRRMILK